MTTQRSTKDGPFCWVSKAALAQILETAGDAEGLAQRARSVYLALCELASDAGSERVMANKALIGYRAGISVRTVQRVFPDLERAGVLKIEHNANGNGTLSAYCLLSVPGHNGFPSGHNGRTPRHGGASVMADKVKERKEQKEHIAPNGAMAARSKLPRTRNPLLDALAAVDGSDPAQVTGPAWGGIATALKNIVAVCPNVTPAEVTRRASNYRQHMRGAMLTAPALAKHWAICDHAPQQIGHARHPELREVK